MASNGSSLTEAGQLFFNSEEPLALRDTDNLTDVYEWEPAGTGSCSAESPTFSMGSGDCLGLISTGSSPFNSKLLGVSANGTDAYFFTRDTLAPQDENGELVKIYDARENGGFFVTPEPPLCKSSDECHGAGSSPPPPPDFHRDPGKSGNLVETKHKDCRAGFVNKHGKCVKKPKHHNNTSELSIAVEARSDRPPRQPRAVPSPVRLPLGARNSCSHWGLSPPRPLPARGSPNFRNHHVDQPRPAPIPTFRPTSNSKHQERPKPPRT